MTIFLLRHTESLSNKQGIADSGVMDTELSERGIEEAQELVAALSENNYDLFIVSPLKRAIQTIRPFLDTLKNPRVVTEPLIIERDLGEFAGTPRGTFTRYCEENNLDKVSFRPENGESVIDVYERAKKFFNLVVEQYKEKTILICGHQIFLRCLELVLSGEPVEKYHLIKSLSNGEIREFEI